MPELTCTVCRESKDESEFRLSYGAPRQPCAACNRSAAREGMRRLTARRRGGEVASPAEPEYPTLDEAIVRQMTGSDVVEHVVIVRDRKREPGVVRAVIRRANGTCEACREAAPFLRSDGTPYLEVHHVVRMCDGGLDHPSNAAGVCPNCHARIHKAADGAEYNAALGLTIQRMYGMTL
jgi:5-methylcytosine-specific restriction endonuclease McrA